MTSQILSFLRPSVRRVVVRAALLALTLSLSHALFAQARTIASAYVPFAFTTGDKVLPAGQYAFVKLNERVYALQSVGKTVQIFNTLAGDSPKKDAGVNTVFFNKYGSIYFLEGAWFASGMTGIRLFQPKAEKEIVASNKVSAPTGVVLAMNTDGDRK